MNKELEELFDAFHKWWSSTPKCETKEGCNNCILNCTDGIDYKGTLCENLCDMYEIISNIRQIQKL